MWQQNACLLCFLVLVSSLQICWTRPQQQRRQDADSNLESGRLVTDERVFYAPGAWHPVVSQPKRDIVPRVHIDQDRSRVRGERGEIIPRVKRQNDGSSSEAPSTTTPTPVVESRQRPTSPLGDSIHKVTSQLLGAREPPNMKHKNTDEQHHKGVAVPVILEEHELDNLEKVEQVLLNNRNTNTQTDNPEPGLSTWVLLSGSSSAPSTASPGKNTPALKPNKKVTATTPTPAQNNKLTKPAMTTTTTTTTTISPTRTAGNNKTPTTTTHKPVATTSTNKQTGGSSKKPTTPASIETNLHKVNKVKVTQSPSGQSKNKTLSTMDVSLVPAMTRKPPATAPKPTEMTATTSHNKEQDTSNENSVTVSTLVTAEVTSTSLEETSEDNNSNSTETTTKRTRRPGSSGSKKKKNKNKRRKNRPSNGSGPESKVTDDGANSTKIAVTKERPLSTRIYNYLAREVMPSVGVGLLGLVVTAGLAGLIMYPFGGGLAARRTYDEVNPTLASTPPGNFYYYNGDYDPSDDSGQAEEAVIQHVFDGMNKAEDESMGPTKQDEMQYPSDVRYSSSATRYNTAPQDIQDTRIANGQVTTYAGDVQGTRYSGVSGSSTNTRRRGDSSDTRRDSYYPSSQQEFKYPLSSAADPTNTQNNQEHKYSQDTMNYGRVRYREVGSTLSTSTYNKDNKNSEVSNYDTSSAQSGSNSANVASYTLQDSPRVSSVVNGNGRVRFREVGSQAVDVSNNSEDSQDNKNTNAVKYGVGQIRYRDAGADVVTTAGYSIQDRKSENIPEYENSHMRYRNVGSRYTTNGQPGLMEQGPRSLRAKRASPDEAKEIETDGNTIANEILMEIIKSKNKPSKKDQLPVKPTKIIKEDNATENLKTVSTERTTISTTMETETLSPTDSIEVEKISNIDSLRKNSAQVSEDMDIETTTLTSEDATRCEDEELTTNQPSEETTVEPEEVSKIPDDNDESEVFEPKPFSFMNFVKQLAHFKIQFGINFLKHTSQSFTRYLDQVQKRMEEAAAQARQVQYKNYPKEKSEAQRRRERWSRLFSGK